MCATPLANTYFQINSEFCCSNCFWNKREEKLKEELNTPSAAPTWGEEQMFNYAVVNHPRFQPKPPEVIIKSRAPRRKKNGLLKRLFKKFGL